MKIHVEDSYNKIWNLLQNLKSINFFFQMCSGFRMNYIILLTLSDM